jgi:hypothetical protein
VRTQAEPARSSRVSRPVSQPAARPARRAPMVPVALGVVAVLIALGILVGGLIPQTPQVAAPGPGTPTVDPGDIAATVNGKPIRKSAWQERLKVAEEDYTDQYGLQFDTTDTGKRMADVLGFDVLDQMINFEVVLQEAAKESIIPNPTQVEQRYQEAQAEAKKENKTWDAFLASQQIHSDAEFRQSIVDGFTYVIMAQNHSPSQGTDDQKSQALGSYICATRAKYDVKVYVTFIVPQTPCSSAGAGSGEIPANLTVPPTQPRLPTPVQTFGPPIKGTP